ncbi:MAG: PQQ-binding-like beta-propeller repeat protein [Verrucomicrobiota bacterium]|nr:PQQ-binding-like beta-propeller repeat protein [Verrucomicrobiota bacterium]
MKSFLKFSFLLFILVAMAVQAGDWPQWRGASRDGMTVDEKPLARLPVKAQTIWQVPVGKGQGGLVLADGKLLVLQETNVGGKPMETAVLVNAANGKVIWKTPYAESWQYRNTYGSGPRVAPIIDGDLVFAQGVKGVLACLSLTEGKLLWSRSYEKDFGAKWFGGNAPGSSGTAASRHGNNGAPVTDDKHIYAAAGGHEGASLVCLEKRTGRLVWKSGNDYAAYSGLMLGELAGVKQVVMVTAANLIGYSTKDGKILWSVPAKTGAARNIVTPILQGDTVTVASHTIGTFQLRISKIGEGLKASQVWLNRDARTNITTPVLKDGYLYGLGTSRGRNSDFVCLNHKTGKTEWSQKGFSDYVSVIAIGDQLLVHSSSGELILLKATPKKYTPLGRLQVSQKSWNFPVYSGGVLYVKDGLRDGDNKLRALKLR